MPNNKTKLRDEIENILYDVSGYDQNITVEEGMKIVDQALIKAKKELLEEFKRELNCLLKIENVVLEGSIYDRDFVRGRIKGLKISLELLKQIKNKS